MHIKFNASIAMILLFSALGTKVLGYPTKYGPFSPGLEPAFVPLNKYDLVHVDHSKSDDIDGEVRLYRRPITDNGQNQIILAFRGTTNGWGIDLHDAQGKSLMSAPFTNGMSSSQMEVFSFDLNGDNQPDFIVNIWSGGTGIAMDGSEVTFLLSSNNSYRATSFFLYSFEKRDLIRFKPQGPVYFISNDLISSDNEKTRDGRLHNFWVYELKRIDGTRFISADADQPGFPKWVWFTEKGNHGETMQLSQEQKHRLLIKRTASK